MVSGSHTGDGVPIIQLEVWEKIQSIREIVGNSFSDFDIYKALETSHMNLEDAAEKLFDQGASLLAFFLPLLRFIITLVFFTTFILIFFVVWLFLRCCAS